MNDQNCRFISTLWQLTRAIEVGSFTVHLPIPNADIPQLCLFTEGKSATAIPSLPIGSQEVNSYHLSLGFYVRKNTGK